MSEESHDLESRLREVLDDNTDVVVRTPPPTDRPALLVADLESTVIENEMLDDLAELAGVGDRVATITARAMNGELDFRGAVEARLELLAGLPLEVVEQARAGVRIDPGARTLVETLRARGTRTALVSGGFTLFAEPLAAELGFDVVHANVLDVTDDHLVGTRSGPWVDRDAKRKILLEMAGNLGCDPSGAVAVGDGANDLAMLGAAGLGIAWRGKPSVAEAAPARLRHGDLRSVLLALGIPRAEWREDPPSPGPAAR